MINFDEDEYLKQLALEFADALEETLNHVESEVVNLSKSGKVSLELTRKVHSMKGSGASFGMSLVSTICHQFEDQLSEYKKGGAPTSEDIDQYLSYVDMLRSTRKIFMDQSLSKDAREKRLGQISELLHECITDSGKRVLVADESKSLISMITAALNGQKLNLVAVNDGLIALSRALTEPFDIVIVSGRLPHLDGTGVVAALKNSGRKKIPYIILLTSSLDDVRFKMCGADEIIAKSKIGLEQLANSVKLRNIL